MNRFGKLLLAGIAAASLGGCVYDGYGYGGVEGGYGYAGGNYAPGYDYYSDPGAYGYGYGWYGDYWYPGTGVLVYDRGGHGRRWSGSERQYWHDHGPRPGGARPNWRGRPGGNWTPPPPPRGNAGNGGQRGFTPGAGRVGTSGHRGHH